MKSDSGRAATLKALVDLVLSGDTQSCFDATRAEELLRSQSTPEELRGIGVPDEIIGRIWT